MKFLIPVDGSPLSLEAVRHVLKLSQAGLDVELLLANVQESASLYEMVVAHDPAVLDEVSEGAGLHVLAPAVSLVEASGNPFFIDTIRREKEQTIDHDNLDSVTYAGWSKDSA